MRGEKGKKSQLELASDFLNLDKASIDVIVRDAHKKDISLERDWRFLRGLCRVCTRAVYF